MSSTLKVSDVSQRDVVRPAVSDTDHVSVVEGGGREPRVQLVIPAAPRYLRLARLTAAGLAGDNNYSIDAIEDLRVALDELCAVIIDDARPGADLVLDYHETPDGIEIAGSCVARSPRQPEIAGVARELLNILADEYSVGMVGDQRSFTLIKRRDS